MVKGKNHHTPEDMLGKLPETPISGPIKSFIIARGDFEAAGLPLSAG